MDPVAHRLANAIVGNRPDAATLEATLVGPELRFDGPATIAITGADLSATVDATAVPMETPVRCRPGGVLRFGQRRVGARAYVAVDGGVDVPSVLGSRSTHVLSAIGGFEGRALHAGDVLPLGPAVDAPVLRRRRSEPRISGGARLRVLAGPQREFFADAAMHRLQSARFIVASQSDRVGYRLQADVAIPHEEQHEMISDATFPGAVQVPASGHPILLMADRQTTGGYPQIGVVITADLPKAAQLAPGDWVEFELCSPVQAISALLEQESRLLAIA
jgi:antagonist of KipI